MNLRPAFRNPYTPGAGHAPPYLAGREEELAEFEKALEQDTILENVILTGLRGAGKTVLLERFKNRAIEVGWLWAGNDLSEAASITEVNMAIRIITDLSIAASGVSRQVEVRAVGFASQGTLESVSLSFDGLLAYFDDTPGLVSDKLRAVLEYAWSFICVQPGQHMIFAYDEAQNLADHSSDKQFPLSLLLDVFQSIQKKGIPFMLVLTGLPTLFPKLVEARTYTERMFHVITLGRLSDAASRAAVTRPIEAAQQQDSLPFALDPESVEMVVRESAGYPYFIQFICREVFDLFLQQLGRTNQTTPIPLESIRRKLDNDFFSGRWARVTDRQRDLLWVVASCDSSFEEEFTIQMIVEKSKGGPLKAFSPSQTNQMLGSLSQMGLIYKNRFGKYSFAVPLLGAFILRTYAPDKPQLPF